MMKLQTILTAAVISLSAGVANAATVWMPTNEDTDFLQFEIAGLSTNGGSLALFDEADFGGMGLLIGTTGGEVSFQANGSHWDAGFNGNSITLLGDYNFVLGMSWDGGSTWYEDSSYLLAGGPPDSYQINFDGFNAGLEVMGSTLGVDLQPVPVPAAVWLFGSGLLGLTAIARRRS
jgi:hypothetical protein